MKPLEWEQLIAERLLPHTRCSTALSASDEQSFALYTRLVASFRFGTIADVLPNTTRLLRIALGDDALRALLEEYVSDVPPTLFPSDEALAFGHFMTDRALAVPGLSDVLRFETGLIEAVADSRTVRIVLSRDIEVLLADIATNRLPQPVHGGLAMTIEIGADTEPFVRVVQSVAQPSTPS